MIDQLAERYGCLPSQVFAQATTFDLEVMDVSFKWQQHLKNQAEGKPDIPQLTQSEMMEMLSRVRQNERNQHG